MQDAARGHDIAHSSTSQSSKVGDKGAEVSGDRRANSEREIITVFSKINEILTSCVPLLDAMEIRTHLGKRWRTLVPR